MRVGDFFDGRYTIEGILGRGGMSTVYLARNTNTGTLWAIKEIYGREGTRANLPAEPDILRKLKHPALPGLFDILERNGMFYMVFDYIDGISLDRKMEAEKRIEERTVVNWGIQLCRALVYLHTLKPNPIIFRDMKPSNIILTHSGTLKLIDFGIAREYKPESCQDTVYIGTRGYAAPEQYGTGQTSPMSDIYSLGVTLHHLLTRQNPAEDPFRVRPIRYYDNTLSIEMERIVSKCTMQDPLMRYQNVTELLKELEALYEKMGEGYMCAGLPGPVRDGRESGTGGQEEGPEESGPPVELGMWEPRLEEKGSGAKPGMGEPWLKGRSGAESNTGTGYGKGHTLEQIDKKRHGGWNILRPFIRQGHENELKRQVITIWDNAEFGCELAYVIAKHTKAAVVLIDLDLLAPKADIFLDIKKYPSNLLQDGLYGRSGLDLLMDALGKGGLSREILYQAATAVKGPGNLRVLTGNYRMENYEYYDEESVPKIIDKCCRYFDVTLLLVNRFIYDAFTLAALLSSDVNIAPIRCDIDKLREFNNYIAFLNDKQRLAPENTRFVFFEFDREVSPGLGEAREATRHNLLGIVSVSRKRLLHRNMKGSYAIHMEKAIEREYLQILEGLGLVPDRSSPGKIIALQRKGRISGDEQKKTLEPVSGMSAYNV